MKNITLILSSLVVLLHATPTQAQDQQNPTPLAWGMSAGWNQYKESGLMQLSGPEVGLHGVINHENDFRFEADVLLGSQRYESQKSGDMDRVANLESRWRFLTPVLLEHTDGLYIGAAVHTLWNDLRGTTYYNGKTYTGYERSAEQLWLPVRWQIDTVWQLDAGLLIYGRHTSKLSQASHSYSDITNTQKRGHYLQVSAKHTSDSGHVWSPFIRYTQLSDSDIVVMGGSRWLEPQSTRWQLGAVLQFDAP